MQLCRDIREWCTFGAGVSYLVNRSLRRQISSKLQLAAKFGDQIEDKPPSEPLLCHDRRKKEPEVSIRPLVLKRCPRH